MKRATSRGVVDRTKGALMLCAGAHLTEVSEECK